MEIVGKPKEHIEKTMDMYLDKIKADKIWKLIKVDRPEAEKHEKEMFSVIAEVELEAKTTGDLVTFCYEYMPGSVEVLVPAELIYKAPEFTAFINDMQAKLHNVDMNHGSRIDYDKPYSSLGPGSDESDRILYGYINSLSRDQRRCIDPIEGFKKLVLATYKSSKVNLDVGGIPNIYLMTGQDDNPVKRFSERDSLLLTEIVRASSKGFISEDESTGLYGEIIEGCDFDTCEDRLIRLAGERKKELELFLRGYK